MKYPYIGQRYSAFVLFYEEDKGLLIGDALGLDENTKIGNKISINDGVNITTEYLSNTYGKVESPEHAEFIIELCETNSIKIGNVWGDVKNWFLIGENLVFLEKKEPSILFLSEKQITIPMPPKKQGVSANDFNEAAKKVSLTLGGDKDWPQVNDEVMFTDLLQHYDEYREEYCNKVSKVIARVNTDQGEFITVHREYCAVMTVRVDRVTQGGALIKPKTEDEILRDEVSSLIENLLDYDCPTSSNAEYIADNLLSQYSITKKPQ